MHSLIESKELLELVEVALKILAVKWEQSKTVSRNTQIFRLYLKNYNLSEIADMFGLTRERVRQIDRKSVV